MLWTIETHGPEEIMALGNKLAQAAPLGTIIALNGEMGAGKTYFAKGIGAGLGVREPITSPTFTIINEYQGRKCPFYHMDFYRVGDAAAAVDLGIEEYFNGNGLVALEWAELIEDLLPPDYILIEIEKCYNAQGEEWRQFNIREMGAQAPWLKEALAGYENTSH